MCAILTNYLICNVPAATVLAVDPYAKRLSKVQTTLLHININSFLILQPSRHVFNRRTFQPMCWLGWALLSTRCFMCFAIQHTGLRNEILISVKCCFNMFQGLILGAIEPITLHVTKNSLAILWSQKNIQLPPEDHCCRLKIFQAASWILMSNLDYWFEIWEFRKKSCLSCPRSAEWHTNYCVISAKIVFSL